MPTFNYKAKDSAGKTVDGSLEAPDSRAAAAKIREMGCWPLDVRQVGGVAAEKPTNTGKKIQGSSNPFFPGATVRAQAVFFRQLATLLGSGVYLSEALDSLGRQSGMGKLPVIARQAADHVRNGGMLSQVMSAYPTLFSRVQIGLVEVGERGGMLEGMISKAADYTERDAKIRRKFGKITFYPKAILVFLILIVTFLPHVKEIVTGGMPVVVQITERTLLPLAAAVLIIWGIVRVLLLLEPVRYGWDRFKLGVPVIGTVIRKLAMSRFASTLAVLYTAGVPLGEAVDMSAESQGNEALRIRLKTAVPQIRAGGNLLDALKRAGGVPEMVLGMISTGERTGSIDTVLEKVSEYYDSEADASIEKLGWLLFILLIIIAGITVAYVFITFFVDFYRGLDQVGGRS